MFNAPAGFAIEQSWSLTLEFAGAKPKGEAAAGAAPFAPNIDRPMPIWICGDNPQSQKFAGQVRMVCLTNE